MKSRDMDSDARGWSVVEPPKGGARTARRRSISSTPRLSADFSLPGVAEQPQLRQGLVPDVHLGGGGSEGATTAKDSSLAWEQTTASHEGCILPEVQKGTGTLAAGEEAKVGSLAGKLLWNKVTKNLARINDAARLKQDNYGFRPATSFSEMQLTRISMRLDGMDNYGVLGALITGFSLQLVSSIGMPDFEGSFHSFFASACVLFGSMTTVCALYATVIFALCSLHGKASIGLNKDDGYMMYITKTATYRESGFIALMSAFVGILATLICMLFVRTPTFTACLACAAILSFLRATYAHVRGIMSLASRHIYR